MTTTSKRIQIIVSVLILLVGIITVVLYGNSGIGQMVATVLVVVGTGWLLVTSCTRTYR